MPLPSTCSIPVWCHLLWHGPTTGALVRNWICKATWSWNLRFQNSELKYLLLFIFTQPHIFLYITRQQIQARICLVALPVHIMLFYVSLQLTFLNLANDATWGLRKRPGMIHLLYIMSLKALLPPFSYAKWKQKVCWAFKMALLSQKHSVKEGVTSYAAQISFD